MTIAPQEIARRGSLASFMQNHYEQLSHSPRYLSLLGRDRYIHFTYSTLGLHPAPWTSDYDQICNFSSEKL